MQNNHLASYIPPPSFGTIATDLYRSNIPSEPNFSFLERLSLNSFLVLGSAVLGPSLHAFSELNGIDILRVPIDEPNDRLVKRAMDLLCDRAYYPSMVMCVDGLHLTGLLHGAIRIFQRWNFTSIIVEYRGFAGISSRTNIELSMEMLDTDLISFPSWLALNRIPEEEPKEDDPPWLHYFGKKYTPVCSKNAIFTEKSLLPLDD
ncbi:hypothetical protein PCE1_002957 [Barthelona sp. PCE]